MLANSIAENQNRDKNESKMNDSQEKKTTGNAVDMAGFVGFENIDLFTNLFSMMSAGGKIGEKIKIKVPFCLCCNKNKQKLLEMKEMDNQKNCDSS